MQITPTFRKYAPMIVFDLEKELRISHADACAIVGNLGHESGGFEHLKQLPRADGRCGDGLGLAQWSGARHKLFVAACAANKLDPLSIKASVVYLIKELRGAYAYVLPHVIAQSSLATKAAKFEELFEGAGVPALASRFAWAHEALNLPQSKVGIL
jgi:hypothetical protein